MPRMPVAMKFDSPLPKNSASENRRPEAGFALRSTVARDVAESDTHC